MTDAKAEHLEAGTEPVFEFMSQEGTATAKPAYMQIIRPTPMQEELTGIDPQDWSKKVPGDVDQIKALATRVHTTAVTMSDQRKRLMDVDVATYWSSDSAKAFTNYKEQLPPRLDLAHKRYQGTGAALTTYNQKLSEAQQLAQTASRRATSAKDQIEAAGHHVTEWPQYCAHQPDPVSPYPQPDKKDGTSEKAVPGIEAPVVSQPMKPQQSSAVPAPSKVSSNSLVEAYQEFYAALRQMCTAIDNYDTAATTCAKAINHASDDSLKDSAGFGADVSKLKTELLKALSGAAPKLRDQLTSLTGVAGMLGLIAAVTRSSGTGGKDATSKLKTDAIAWQNGTGKGKKVVDDFLDVLGKNSGKLSIPPMSHIDNLHKGSVQLDPNPLAQGDQNTTDNTTPTDNTTSSQVQPTQSYTTQGPDGTYTTNIYIGAPSGGGAPQVTSNTVPVPSTA